MPRVGPDEAASTYRRLFAIADRRQERQPPHVLMAWMTLAAIYKDQGRMGEAEALCREVIAIEGDQEAGCRVGSMGWLPFLGVDRGGPWPRC